MSDLERVVKMANILLEQIAEYERLEAETKAAKKRMLATEREDLPELLKEVGLTTLTLDSGQVIKLESDCEASITKANFSKAVAWLIKNECQGIIKTNVVLSFGRGEKDKATKVAQKVAKLHSDLEVNESIHAATLKAFVKERLKNAEPIPQDLFGVRAFSKAVVKKQSK